MENPAKTSQEFDVHKRIQIPTRLFSPCMDTLNARIVTDNNTISVDAEETLPWNQPNEICALFTLNGDRGERNIARKSKLIGLSAI